MIHIIHRKERKKINKNLLFSVKCKMNSTKKVFVILEKNESNYIPCRKKKLERESDFF